MTVQETAESALRHHRAGRTAEAEKLYRQVLAQRPDHADALNLLGVLLHQSGRNAEALESIDRSIRLNPQAAVYHNNLGLVLLAEKRFDDAEAAYRRTVELDPSYADAHYSLGWIYQRAGKLDEATRHFQRVLTLRPDHILACNQLGNLLSMQKRWDEAIAAYRKALAVKADYPDAHINLGNALKEQGKIEDAIAEYKQALAAQPDFPEAWNNLANALKGLRRFEQAAAAYRHATTLRPTYADAHFNLAIVLHDLNQLDDSIAESKEAIRLASAHPVEMRQTLGGAYNNLANAFKSTGRLDEAIDAYRQSAELIDEPWAQVNLMQTISFHPDYTPQQNYQEHVKWNERFARPLAPIQPRFNNVRDPDRRLKIGYVASDFRDHCQSFFTAPLLSHHDHSRFEIFCYSNVAVPDHLTERLRGYADHWRDISSITDEKATELVRQDQIDVLIDLTMHMERNRIMIFARKPAPVQVTWLAYPGTTGLAVMDYRFSDPYLDPGFNDSFYAEKTRRLPHSFWCYDPLTSEPQVNDLPALANGHITFGCLNNVSKVTDRAIEMWTQVLKTISNSRMQLLVPEGSARTRVGDLVGRCGIDPSRIDFVGWQARPSYLRQYQQIDLCLDPFPCPGHTTTMDGLWMGVPVVNLPGATAIARGAISILSNVGIPQFLARDSEHYVQIAQECANDLPRLAELRSTLRRRMESSPLMNAPAFTHDFETALREMWRKWCDSHETRK